MKVLIACEESGTVRDYFIEAGHDAISCDLKPTRKPGPHYQGDVFDIINDGFDLMIAHPPCTDLAVSGAAHFKKKIADGRQGEAVDLFMRFAHAPIGRIAIENPIGIMSSRYRKPDQIIDPSYFGDDARKPTCLWLKNLPKLFWSKRDDLFSAKTYIEPTIISMKSKKTGRIRTYSKWEYEAACNQKERATIRSKTFDGIAKAMVAQWGILKPISSFQTSLQNPLKRYL